MCVIKREWLPMESRVNLKKKDTVNGGKEREINSC